MKVRFAGFKNLTQGILFCFLIIAIVLFIAWFIISIIGNVIGNSEVKAPDIEKARYAFYLKATNKIVYTDYYETDGDSKYILHGYYEYNENKYKWHDKDLVLDEYYWGTIKVIERSE